MFYCIINNVHVDYAALIWEGLHYQHMSPIKNNPLVPYLRFTKLIIDHILTTHLDILKRSNESHYLVTNDDVVQSILASRKSKERRMGIPDYFQEDPGTRIDPGSQKESLEAMKVYEYVDIDEGEEEETVEAELIRKKWNGSLEIRDTPLATPLDPLGLKPYHRIRMQRPVVSKTDLSTILKKVKEALYADAVKQEHEQAKAELVSMVVDVVQKEQERKRVKLSSQVTNDLATNVSPHVEAFLKNYINNNISHVHPTSTSSSIPDLQHQLLDHDDHHDDALPEGESKYDKWSGDQGTDDDEAPFEEATPEFLVEISGKGMKWVPTSTDKKRMEGALDNIMRIRYMSSKEYAYYLDQMKSYMENQIVRESRAEYLTVQVPNKIASIYQGCDRNPNAPTRYLYNKDIFYLKYGNSETRKYVLSLHKIHAISFPENDLEELKPIWARVHDYQLELESYQLKVNLTAPILMVPGIEDLTPYSIITLPVVGLIYENIKKINLDVKHGYEDPPLSKEDVDLINFHEEHIQEWLKHRVQMRRWEIYVNGRPIQNLRERPE
ncbi:hypothetical protein Tco_0948897 [Tanacetum coccineum]